MSDKVFIIAEAGVNHNGDIKLAKELIDAAVESKADAVKFQTFISENFISRGADKAEYQKKMTGNDESQIDMIKKLELSFDTFIELKEYCGKRNIIFMSTPFDFASVDFLNKIGLETFKIPSGEITNFPLLKKVGQLQKKVIMSTGMSTIDDIRIAIGVLKGEGTTDISLLHCNTQYPTPMEDVNLRAMLTLKKEFGVSVGYSDHTEGIEVPIAAVALGADIIEKHFTLNRNMPGPDHKASLEPYELKNMVACIRNIEKALGICEKRVTDSERENIGIARKSIVALKPIKKGEIFTEENLTVKRPGTGISPMHWNEIIGKISYRDYCVDEMIKI